MSGQFDWVFKWLNDPKTRHQADIALNEYKYFINGSINKYLPWTPTDYEVIKFREYENIQHH